MTKTVLQVNVAGNSQFFLILNNILLRLHFFPRMSRSWISRYVNEDEILYLPKY